MNTADRRQTVWSVLQAASEAPSLASLQERIRRSETYLETVRPFIPSGLHKLVQAGPLVDDEWCLIVNSSAAGTKLRQLIPKLIRELNSRGHQVTGIRLKILAPTR